MNIIQKVQIFLLCFLHEIKKYYNEIKHPIIYLQKIYIKIFAKKVGKNFKLYGLCNIKYIYNLEIGDDVIFNDNIYINSMCPVRIGNDVTISSYAKIIAADRDINKWIQSNGKLRIHSKDNCIMIGNHIWIASGATILNGVSILGNYVVIAAGAVVTKNINENHVVVAGVPSKIVKKIDIKK